MSSSAWPLQVAVAAALLADATLATLLPVDSATGTLAVYNGAAREGAPLTTGDPVAAPSAYRDGRVILRSPTEQRADSLMRAGHAGTLTLDVYTQDASEYQALAIYAAIASVLGTPARLTLAGHQMAIGTFSLVTTLADPGTQGRHLVASYRVQTLVGA